MQFGMIGLGRMGANMVRRLMKGGHTCVVYDRSADAVAGLVKEGATGSSSLAEFVKKLDTPRAPLPDGSGGVRGLERRRARADAREGGHPHRRRQLPLPRRHRPGEAPRGEGAALRRHGDERRRLGPRARLLPDDRRRGRGREAPRSDLRHAGTRQGRHPPHGGPREAGRHRRARLPPLRAQRRRPLREDGPQRHRVRPDGGLRRGAQHPDEGQHRQGEARDRRRDDAAPEPRALPVRLQHRRHRRGLAARQRRRVVAPRPDRLGLRRKPDPRQLRAGRSRTPARGAGRSPRPTTKRCPPTS